MACQNGSDNARESSWPTTRITRRRPKGQPPPADLIRHSRSSAQLRPSLPDRTSKRFLTPFPVPFRLQSDTRCGWFRRRWLAPPTAGNRGKLVAPRPSPADSRSATRAGCWIRRATPALLRFANRSHFLGIDAVQNCSHSNRLSQSTHRAPSGPPRAQEMSKLVMHRRAFL